MRRIVGMSKWPVLLALALGSTATFSYLQGKTHERNAQASVLAQALQEHSLEAARLYRDDLAQMENRHERELRLARETQRPPVAALDCPVLGDEWLHDYTSAVEAAARAGGVVARPAEPGDPKAGASGVRADQ